MKFVELNSAAWFGDIPIKLEFPDHWQIEIVGNQSLPVISPTAIKNCILQPVASLPLAQIAAGRQRAAIIIDDLTRPTPTAPMISMLVGELIQGGIKPEYITIVIAGGTHSPATPEDIAKKIGNNLPEGICYIAHDSRQPGVKFGITRHGIPVFINRAVMACDLKIGVGCIYPHPAAGFSGGGKVLVPGVAGFETIRCLHDHLQGSEKRAGLLESEFRTEIEKIAAQIGLDFIVNVTINQQRQISSVFAGDMIQAFRCGVEFARIAYSVNLQPDADIIIADMYPFDTDLQFAYDRGLWPIEAARNDASRVILASCPKGLGSHELFPADKSFQSRLVRRLKHFRWKDLPTLGKRLAAAHRLLARKSLGVMFVSQGLSAQELKSVFPAGQLYPDWLSARSALEQKHGRTPLKVAIYQCAPLMISKERQPVNLR